ncbi:hypothetical protein ILUMI_24430 [Ignelater luminosus]|uniref:Fatty acid hydroxylase domain-containing protein n=1 Tax=Ignelater luminosus TaxID=2038154 RepID=A0A8K0CBY5_IGNLU|nr:hypothetical protein ILUMI_24430 [Ignelater luminosus]
MLCQLLQCQRFWDKFLDTVGEDPITLWVYVSVILGTVLFWLAALGYTFLDLFAKPSSLMKYKIQPGVNEPVSSKQFFKLVVIVLRNQFLTLPAAYLFYKSMQWRGYASFRELPAFSRLMLDLVVMILWEEIAFYYIHRFLHNKYVFKYLHKRHHEWKAPIALSALYSGSIEHILVNIIPTLFGTFVMGSHLATFYLWLSVTILGTLLIHSGYHLPYLPSPEFHDFHHLKFNQNYGVFGILDRISGTDEEFKKTIAYTRHSVMLNLTSPREMYPDVQEVNLIKNKNI